MKHVWGVISSNKDGLDIQYIYSTYDPVYHEAQHTIFSIKDDVANVGGQPFEVLKGQRGKYPSLGQIARDPDS